MSHLLRKRENSFSGRRKKGKNDGKTRWITAAGVLEILLCAACLTGTAWAWLGANIHLGGQTLTGANFDVEVSVTDPEGKPVLETSDGYSLLAGQAYQISIAAVGTASGGYCEVKGNEATYDTVELKTGERELTFTLIPEKEGNYIFIPQWGEPADEADISAGSVIGKSESE